MSIKRIETMSGSDIMRLFDNSEYCSDCDKCPLNNDDEHCNYGFGSCLSSIVEWLYEDVEEPEINDENESDNMEASTTVLLMSRIATAIHDLIESTMGLSGLGISASAFVQMIADRISEESNND